jgi:hypothetical protein
MTLTAPTPGQNDQRIAVPIQWTVVQSGLWVGKASGEFAGMIEARWGEGFAATTRLGKNLGMFATVEEAKAGFVAK